MDALEAKVLWDAIRAKQDEMDQKLAGLFNHTPEELEELFRERARLLAARPEEAAREGRPHLVCAIGQEYYGVPIAQVEKILVPERYPGIPLAIPGLKGMLNYQNEIIPVASLRGMLGLEDPDAGRRVVVVLSAEGARFGCEMDRVVELANIQDDILAAGRKHPVVAHLAPYGGLILGIIDATALYHSLVDASKEG